MSDELPKDIETIRRNLTEMRLLADNAGLKARAELAEARVKYLEGQLQDREGASKIDSMQIDTLLENIRELHNQNSQLRARAERAEADAKQMHSDNRRMAIANETMDIALQQIIRWCDAYPADVFGEPDLEKARKLLEGGGITLDSISAYAVRQVVSAIRGYAQAALIVKDGER